MMGIYKILSDFVQYFRDFYDFKCKRMRLLVYGVSVITYHSAIESPKNLN